jgi:hypothetical protein
MEEASDANQKVMPRNRVPWQTPRSIPAFPIFQSVKEIDMACSTPGIERTFDRRIDRPFSASWAPPALAAHMARLLLSRKMHGVHGV